MGQLPLFSRRAFVAGGAATTLSAAAYGRVLGANDRVGVGFIGYGLIGKRHVIDFREQGDADLVAVAEAHRGRLDEAREFIGGPVRPFADFRRLLDDRDVQAVVVSTPDHWHALMTMLACAAGKDVYVEKPLTLFVREGRWMIDVARRTGRVVQVGTQQRSGMHYRRARELLAAGKLGRVVSVRMSAFRNIMPGYGSPADCEPPDDLDWEMWLGPAPKRAYNPNRGLYHFRWFWDYSGGQMTNLGQHALDIVHWFLDVQAPSAVSGAGGRFCLADNGETPDTQDAIVEYPGLNAIWSHREGSQGRGASGLEFYGTHG
ncbi:MAG TPA: Gfo/Idh/MocA family oxidoreductase, partial [Pirellulales bacterium]|nr:Gfo/Idh/MocA family oxidoreductase [Pirellulales bacterium]